MEDCFRFLINVDQCLNMSYFDIFFYKLTSQHKFHMSSVQMSGATAQDQLRGAANDIRAYLDKYPYHVGNYQITVAMRTTPCRSTACWEDTMLRRLLSLDHALRDARILIDSREHTEKALNLIMLYDVDYSFDLPDLGLYMSSGRLQQDCAQLLELLSLSDKERSVDAMDQALLAYRADSGHDTGAAALLQDFFLAQRKSRDQLEAMAEYVDPTEDGGNALPPLSLELAKFVRDRFSNVQLFEQQVDRNSRRQQTLALLRVVEFINMSTELPEEILGQQVMVPLTRRCANNWQKIWSDPTLEQRYADMLWAYQRQLRHAAQELDGLSMSSMSTSPLPEEDIPEDGVFTSGDSVFSNKDPLEEKQDLIAILQQVLDRNFSLRTIQADWKTAYAACRQLLDNMEHALEDHAKDLSRKYAATLEKRKQGSAQWQRSVYFSAPDTERDITRLEHERDQRLRQLKEPHMTASLIFQDQLNMESALEQEDLLIRHYIRSLSAVTAGNFLLLIGICLLIGIGHYSFLQTYVFQSIGTVGCYLIYIACIAVLMLLCWLMPYNYFRKKLRASVSRFKDAAEKFISGYYEKAEHFSAYIDLINQLDYITRYHRLLVRAHRMTHMLSQGHLWHKVRLQEHLSKLQFFRGLIDLGTPSEEDPITSLPGIDGTQVCDYIDSPVYWPQKTGGHR